MSYHTRGLSSNLRGASGTTVAGAQSPALLARIEEKKAELEHLKELRDLSSSVATQMEALEKKLSTLSDGTEAIATVVGNWHNVLRAINMASANLSKAPQPNASTEDLSNSNAQLPQTLVRIPTEHAPTLQAQAEAAEAAAAEGGNENTS